MNGEQTPVPDGPPPSTLQRAPLRGAWLGDLTWPEAQGRIRDGAVVLIPVGAAAKEHGPHLPLDTDFRTARALTEGVIAALPVLAAPVVGYGYYPAFRGWPGSTHLSAETFQAVVRDLAESLARQGVRRIGVINTGVSTEAPLQIVARHLRDAHGVKMAVADIRNLGRAAEAVLDNPAGGHADERETSILLALAPDAVRRDRIPDGAASGGAAGAPPGPGVFRAPVELRPHVPADDLFGARDFSLTGATGDPSRASAEKGRRILDAMVDDLVEGLRMAFPDVLP